MREPGYYWIIARDGIGRPDEEWSIGHYENGDWSICGDDRYHGESDVERVGPRVNAPDQPFPDALVALCREHNAVIYPRKDSERMYVSVEIGPPASARWLDFTRISGEGAEKTR